MTVLYNTETGEIIGRFEPCYLVNGKPGRLDPPIVELAVTETEPPAFDRKTETLIESWQPDTEAMQYVQYWKVTEAPAANVPDLGWNEPDYQLRIKAPLQLALSDLGAKIYTWFSINALPVEKVGSEVHLYCNEVLPEHTAILTEMQITPQQTPYKGYLLNLASGEIHRLANETLTCNIAQIVESESLTLKQALTLIRDGTADGCAHCFAEQSKINKP